MATFATCPDSVRAASWKAWEAEPVCTGDRPAPELLIDEEVSDLSGADSPHQRRQKLRNMARAGPTHAQVARLRSVRRRARRSLGNMTSGKHSRPGIRRHIEDVTVEVDAVLSWNTYQTRNADGAFGRTAILPRSETT